MSQLSILEPTPLELPIRGARLMGRRKLTIEDLNRPDVQARISSIVPLLRAAQTPEEALNLHRSGNLIYWIACTYLKPPEFERVTGLLIEATGDYVLGLSLS